MSAFLWINHIIKNCYSMNTFAENNKLKKALSITKRWKSFNHALNGILLLFAREANAKIQFGFAILVLIVAAILQINTIEWIIIIACIGWVLFAEAVNTSIEYIADYIQPNYHFQIKNIKDIAAGAVLISAFTTALIGGLIFIPKFLNLIL